jgi:hypothetical protein
VEFAVGSIFRWWKAIGEHAFRGATNLMITCDYGGSNSNRTKMWKYQIGQLARRIDIEIHVCHFPLGTSKWNKVEHRLFCYISKNRQREHLIDIETAIDLIGATTIETELKVICQRDNTVYELKKSVSDEDFGSINMDRIAPFENWSYLFKPS